MICEPLDPMFCPASLFCTDWDCKCYGPGNNDNTTIAGTLGKTVIDGDKSTLYCGCGTDELQANAAKSETPMPFQDKATLSGDRVMEYQCCDDYFDGYQCTLWDYSNQSSPVSTIAQTRVLKALGSEDSIFLDKSCSIES